MADPHTGDVGDRVERAGRENSRREPELTSARARLGWRAILRRGGGRQQDERDEATAQAAAFG